MNSSVQLYIKYKDCPFPFLPFDQATTETEKLLIDSFLVAIKLVFYG